MRALKKPLLSIMAIVLFSSLVMAQQQKASPPMTASANVNGNDITINYSSPSVKGREIWGGLVPYDKVWRTGANEATTIEFSKDVKVDGKSIAAGKYGFFTIPGKDKWTVVINSVANQWGAYSYDQSKDVLRFEVTPEKNQMTESLAFTIASGGNVKMAWEKLNISFDVK